VAEVPDIPSLAPVTFPAPSRFMRVREAVVGEESSTDSERSDAELVRAMRGSDERAFYELYERYADRLFNYLRRRAGDAAEDLLQQTFLRAFEAADRWQPRASVSAWLYTIATNLARDHARREVVRSTPGQGTPPERFPQRDVTGAPESELSRSELRGQLERAVRALPEHEQEAFLLGKFEGRSYAEIAEILGTTEGAIKVRIHRAMKTLQTSLGEWLR
jgi:RNA polymerase sigma-70 factor (ECF subfamily)